MGAKQSIPPPGPAAAPTAAAPADPVRVEPPVPAHFLSQARHSLGTLMPEFMRGMPVGCIHIAVIGGSGTGKTSIVNALRELGDADLGAAIPNSTGRDGTTAPTPYWYPGKPPAYLEFEDPSLLQGGRWVLATVPVCVDGQKETVDKEVLLVGNMAPETWTAMISMPYNNCTIKESDIKRVFLECIIWDMPGVGTVSFPKREYVKKMGLQFFDAVMFVHGVRIMDFDVLVIRELERLKVPTFHVRGKIDIEMFAARRKARGVDAKREAEKKVMEEIRATLLEELKVPTLYMVCAFKPGETDEDPNAHWDSFDFPRLRNDLGASIAHCRRPIAGQQ